MHQLTIVGFMYLLAQLLDVLGYLSNHVDLYRNQVVSLFFRNRCRYRSSRAARVLLLVGRCLRVGIENPSNSRPPAPCTWALGYRNWALCSSRGPSPTWSAAPGVSGGVPSVRPRAPVSEMSGRIACVRRLLSVTLWGGCHIPL